MEQLARLDSFGITHVGRVRERNEDVWAADLESGLFIVADGMGGHLGGEVAAQEAVARLSLLVEEKVPLISLTEMQAKEMLLAAVEQVNTELHTLSQADEQLRGMGTTLSALLCLDHHALLIHVGDSRIYRLNQGRLEQLTEDHSLVCEMLTMGLLSNHQAATFPYKHILTRALGTQKSVEPFLSFVSLDPGMIFLLCTDGLTNYVREEQIQAILQAPTPLSMKAEQFVELANQQGGGDNITALLLKVLL